MQREGRIAEQVEHHWPCVRAGSTEARPGSCRSLGPTCPLLREALAVLWCEEPRGASGPRQLAPTLERLNGAGGDRNIWWARSRSASQPAVP
jgi:hypothetical protein